MHVCGTTVHAITCMQVHARHPICAPACPAPHTCKLPYNRAPRTRPASPHTHTPAARHHLQLAFSHSAATHGLPVSAAVFSSNIFMASLMLRPLAILDHPAADAGTPRTKMSEVECTGTSSYEALGISDHRYALRRCRSVLLCQQASPFEAHYKWGVDSCEWILHNTLPQAQQRII